MSLLLQTLHLAPVSDGILLPGLVSVKDDSLSPLSIPEKVAQCEARLLEGGKDDKNIGIDYIFFRRFADERSPQVAAYVLDNSKENYSPEQIAELHRRVWLNGTSPLLYVEWPTQVDVLMCAAEPVFWDKRTESTNYVASESIETTAEISNALDTHKVSRFSAYRLSNGTFWDDPENSNWARADKASHKAFIRAAVDADTALDGANNPLMRRLLLLTILSKYLEDRGVFPKEWFTQWDSTAYGFNDVLKSGKSRAVKKMLTALREKFNGDIFDLSPDIEKTLNQKSLNHFVTLLEANTINKQMYLWKQYSFNYIPIEVLSHLYQHFAQSGTGAVFTPPFVADLMLDHAMPFGKMSGQEKVLDPTCGSGVFLVGAFRRLVHHWQSHHDWKRPGVPVLKAILRKSIFGAELSPEAAHVASFNLALAMCDALQPKVIWSHLRFDKLIGRNIIVGDFFEKLPSLKAVAQDGFDVILGNPPFLSKLTTAAKNTRNPEKKKIPIPDGQIAYCVAEKGMELLHPEGRLCLIEPSGFLYNAKARKFLADFLTSNTVDTILDFVSIRNLFEGADPKTIAILARAGSPDPGHKIIHQTFRRTKSVHDRIGFERDHYDHHVVEQQMAVECPWVWKANLLGGGRLQALASKMSALPTLKNYIEEQGWTHGEGFSIGQNVKRQKKNDWLPGKPFLPTKALTGNGIQTDLVELVTAHNFEAARKPLRFTSPMFIIGENESLPCDFLGKGFLTFQNSIVSINAPAKDKNRLRLFSEIFAQHKKTFSACCLLKSPRALVGKSTAILKSDIEELPWPSNGKMPFAWWEEILLNDVSNHMSKLIRVGQNADLMTQSVDKDAFHSYAETFVKLLGSVYTNLRSGKSGYLNGIAYQSFIFGEASELDWPDDWGEKLEEIVFRIDGASMRTSRVVRFYEQNTLIIIKADRLRHWIRSTAIRDADETLTDLQQQGF